MSSDDLYETSKKASIEFEIRNLMKGFRTLSMNENFYAGGVQTDVLFNIGGEKLAAHKAILSCRSRVFQSMFSADMLEKEKWEVNIDDCDAKTFKAFLYFLYTGRLDIVSPDNAMDLYVVAEKYNIEELKAECCSCLDRHLSVDSICDVLKLATLHQDEKLLGTATMYFVKNSSQIVRTSMWEQLCIDNPGLTKELIFKVTDTLAAFFKETA